MNKSNVISINAPSLNDGNILSFNAFHSKQDNSIAAWCRFSSFSGLCVGHGFDAPWSSAHVDVYPDHIEVCNEPDTMYMNSVWRHDLKISEYLSVVISVQRGNTAFVTIATATGVYKSPLFPFWGCHTLCYMKPLGGCVEDARLSFFDADKKKDIWLFGDSYMDLYPKYMIQNGYGNFALDAFSGRNSEMALASLEHALTHWKAPRYIIWAMGMNDPEPDGKLSADWLSAVNSLLQICEEHDVVPILCTIPNVVIRNNNRKNQYVLKSGCRMCDLASAVQKPGEDAWFEGMLGADEVHPTEQGAYLLAMKMISEIPELFSGIQCT